MKMSLKAQKKIYIQKLMLMKLINFFYKENEHH